jgi:hypothetical protein
VMARGTGGEAAGFPDVQDELDMGPVDAHA